MGEEKKKEGASRSRMPSQEQANSSHVPDGRLVQEKEAGGKEMKLLA